MSWLCCPGILVVGTCQRNELASNWSGHARPQSSQLSELLWTDPDPNRGNSMNELIPTFEKKKRVQTGIYSSNLTPESSFRGKGHHHHKLRMLSFVPILSELITQTDFPVAYVHMIVHSRIIAKYNNLWSHRVFVFNFSLSKTENTQHQHSTVSEFWFQYNTTKDSVLTVFGSTQKLSSINSRALGFKIVM